MTAEMHYVGLDFEEGLKQVIGADGPTGDEFEGIPITEARILASISRISRWRCNTTLSAELAARKSTLTLSIASRITERSPGESRHRGGPAAATSTPILGVSKSWIECLRKALIGPDPHLDRLALAQRALVPDPPASPHRREGRVIGGPVEQVAKVESIGALIDAGLVTSGRKYSEGTVISVW